MRVATKAKKTRERSLLGLLALGLALMVGCGPAPSGTETPAEEPPPSSIGDRAPAAPDSLLDAALAGRTERVRAALAAGADPGAPGQDSRTALMLAAYNGHTETVRVLLDHGARVGDADGSGRTALMYAASGPNEETVRLLLEWKADPLAVDQEERFTALMFAAAEGHADVVRTLLRHGSDPDIVDVDGDKALDFAARNGHQEVIRLLSDEAVQERVP